MRYWILVLVAAQVLAAQGGFSFELPQIRISRIQASDPGNVRIFMSGLDEGMTPMELNKNHLVTLFLSEGEQVSTGSDVSPLVTFDGGAGDHGRMLKLGKADVRQAVIFVVSVHAEVRQDTWDLLDVAMQEVLGGLRPDAQVGVIFYADRIRVLWSVDGTRGDVRSINEYQHCLGSMRADAGKFAKPTGVPCGRLFTRDAAKTLLDPKKRVLPPRQGLFPRLFGLGEVPEVEEAAAARGHERLDRAESTGTAAERERFADGAVEAALRLLLALTEPDTLREVVVLSDGKDGYLGAADLAQDKAAAICSREAKSCKEKGEIRRKKRAAGEGDAADEGASPECTREVLECTVPKIAKALGDRELALKSYMENLIAMLRAAEVRVTAIAIPGSDEVGLARLKVLALKTGGTFWDAATGPVGELKRVAKKVAEEFASEVVALPSRRLEGHKTYTVAAVMDKELKTAPYTFETGARPWPFSDKFWAFRRWMISKLGHGFGPPAFWAVVVAGALMALSMLLTVGKLIKSLIKKAGGKVPKPAIPKGGQPPAPPKVPTLKRPPLPR